GSRGSWRTHRSRATGGEKERPWTGTPDCNDLSWLRRRTRRLLVLARALAVAGAVGCDWLLLHAANGVEQYDFADHHGGFQARACHELLLDRVPGSGSVRQLDGRRYRKPH